MRGSAAFRAAVAPGGVLAGPWVRNELWRSARAVPSLDLRFAENKSLVDATTGQQLVTFTRASSGTYVGSDGLIKTATTNLLTFSEQFDNAAWTKQSSVSVSANAVTAPNGTLTADTITADSGLGIYQNITSVVGLNYVNSVYVKAGTATSLLLRDDTGTGRHIQFNPSTGQITATSGTLVGSGSQAVGDGWFRVWMIYAADATTVRGIIRPASSGSAQTYTVWGAQLEQSSTVGEYIPTTSTINSAPRFDHNPTTGESLGLLVEEQRTNLLVQSSFGSIGTTTANNTWYETFAELDTTVNAGLAPDGTTTASLLSINTPTSFRSVIQRTTSTTAGTYALSIYLKPNSTDTSARVMLSGDTGASNFVRADFTLSGAGTAPGSAGVGGTAVSAAAPAIQALPNGWYRCTIAGTLTAPTGITIFVYPGTTGSQTTNSQTLVWGAQLEAGAFPTSYIPTTTAAVTRSADVASITGSNFSSWYRQDEGTVFQAFSPIGLRTSYPLSIDDGTASSFIGFGFNSAGNRFARIDTGGITQASITQGLVAVSSPSTGAVSYAVNNIGVSFNGTPPGSDSSATVPTVDRLRLHALGGSSTFAYNGTIRRLVYWGQRLPNSVLQAITQ